MATSGSGGISVNVHFSDADEWNAKIDEIVTKAGIAAREIVVDGGHLIEAATKKRAPVKTGTLRRSITIVSTTPLGPTGWISTIAPTTKYGRRIELGFHGRDALGRLYLHDPGRPYFAPGVAEATPKIEALADATWERALR